MPNSTLVNLVRVVVLNTGIDTLQLGAAVSSFRGSEALTDGETYSYSIQQNSNFETGQGVFDARDGTLTRGVIESSAGGVPIPLSPNAVCSFTALAQDYQIPGPPGSPGPKGDPGQNGAPGDNAPFIGTYQQLSTIDVPAGTVMFQTTGFYSPGDGGHALYVLVSGDPGVGVGGVQTADGQWWRYVVFNGPMRIEQFGGRADCQLAGGNLYGAVVGTPTDNIGPFYDMLKQGVYGLPGATAANYKLGPVCEFGCDGVYYFSQQLEPRIAVHLKGQAGGSNNLTGSYLRFPATACGFVSNNRATGNGGVITPGTLGTSEGSTLEDLYFIGGGWGSTWPTGLDPTKHGLWMRATMKVLRCTFDNFPGHGVAIIANNAIPEGTNDPSLVGNANAFYLERVTVRQAGRHGIYVSGVDANAGTSIGCEVVSARLCGLVDLSGLGNTHLNPNIGGANQIVAFINQGGPQTTVCTDALDYGYACVTTDSALAASTEPGTDEKVWYPIYAKDANYPLPTNGIKPWVEGGNYVMGNLGIYAEGDSNTSVFVGAYTEGITCDISKSASIFVGGQIPGTRNSRWQHGVSTSYAALFNNSGMGGYKNLQASAIERYFGGFVQSSVGSSSGLEYNYHAYGSEANGGQVTLQETDDGDYVRIVGGIAGGNKEIDRILQRRSGNTLGRGGNSGVSADSIVMLSEFAIRNAQDNNKFVVMRADTVKPTTGVFGVGERVWNAAPGTGKPEWWTCTTAGGISTATYAANTNYGLGDTVQIGGNCYISGLAAAWHPNTTYNKDDIVSKGGRNYICLGGTYTQTGDVPPFPNSGTSGTVGPTGYANLSDGAQPGGVRWAVLAGQDVMTGPSSPPSGTDPTARQRDGTIFWWYLPPFVLTNGPVL